MSRIFWDSMLFIYSFEDDPLYAQRVEDLYYIHRRRGDEIFASHLAVGETLAGVYLRAPEKAEEVKRFFAELGVTLLPFDGQCSDLFGRLRAQKILSADALHLATAGTAGMDLFLTADKKLLKFCVPGIDFIAGIDTNLF